LILPRLHVLEGDESGDQSEGDDTGRDTGEGARIPLLPFAEAFGKIPLGRVL
jgi:hypothetical protein